MIGQTIAHYRITAKLGEGGMGEVYRAVDTKLDREVALKILPENFAEDADRMARFEREAKVLASLNHPNIAQIYGVEDRALVMELVEGASPRGPLAFDDAWKIAAQIAAALEYAHDRGIIHRDLKPANIKVTPDGAVKLLDFGLAKAFTNQREPQTSAENSPTLTIAATEVGVILGTAAYMPPEQAKGKSVDKRADIWSFGVVLYELLTGERAFQGEDVSETLVSVIRDQPDLRKVPPKARKLLGRCLEKDPKKRLRDIGEAVYLLEEPQELGRAAPVRSRLGWLWPSIAALAIVIAFALAFIHFREKPQPASVLRYTIGAPEGGTVHSFAISPDGHYLAIAAAVNGKRQLWLRPLDALQAQPMPFTEDATFPFWSPDSRYIGFFAQGKLKKVAASGGPSQSLGDVAESRGGSWGRNDVIVFSTLGSSIQRVSAAGGIPVNVVKTKDDQRFPVFVSDGRRFLYQIRVSTADKNGIYVASLDGTENRRILPDASSAVFAPPSHGEKLGHILFIRENTLMAQPFDAARVQPAGDVFPIADGVGLTTNISYAPATVSDSGVLVYQSGGATGGGSSQIGWYDRSGKLLGPVIAPGAILEPAISPDEKTVVFQRMSGAGFDLWLRDLARGTETRFTSDASRNVTPFWSPKSDRIVFASDRRGVMNLFQKGASGSGQDELLLTTGNTKNTTQWSRDGRFIVYIEVDPKTRFDLWVLPMEGSEKERKPIPFLQTEFNEIMGQLSPDSHWMAYTSDQSGRREVYVRPFPPAEGQWTISIAGGEQPRWRGDGKELFYVAADGKMMAVPIKAFVGGKPAFEAGSPVALFDAHIAPTPVNYVFNYDVTADGRRFMIDTPASSGAPPMLNVVVNWNATTKK